MSWAALGASFSVVDLLENWVYKKVLGCCCTCTSIKFHIWRSIIHQTTNFPTKLCPRASTIRHMRQHVRPLLQTLELQINDYITSLVRHYWTIDVFYLGRALTATVERTVKQWALDDSLFTALLSWCIACNRHRFSFSSLAFIRPCNVKIRLSHPLSLHHIHWSANADDVYTCASQSLRLFLATVVLPKAVKLSEYYCMRLGFHWDKKAHVWIHLIISIASLCVSR